MHIGTVRTALFNYLFAKHHGGTYFVRIEDTDKVRNKPEWTEQIWKDFEWCGLIPDTRYIQSEHIARHRELLHALVESGKAFVSKEEAKDGSGRTVEVVRLKNPGTSVTFDDLVRGSVTFDTTELGDFVIARSIDDPLYHFAVVVDDADADVTHVIRGEDHVSNTPRQILILEALGFERPHYAHIPLILASDRSKLSKRKHSASVEHYRAHGFLPEALINYLALLGWNPGTEEEMFTVPELVERFSLDQVQKSGAIFDEKKLRWFNREYLTKLPDEAFEKRVHEYVDDHGMPDVFRRLLPSLRERLETFGDLTSMAESGDLAYYFKRPVIAVQELLGKDATKETAGTYLAHVRSTLESLPEHAYTAVSIKEKLWDYATEQGRGAVLWPMRYALSGKKQSPDPFTLAEILGKEETLARLDAAIAILEG
jgi:glutamyl-tRNA synthetase